MQQYEQAFRDNAIDAVVLAELTADDLKDLGVGLVGHRRKLLAAIAGLRSDIDAAPEPAAVAPTTERRQLTVLFCDLVGSTALSTRLDPEDLREVIGAYHRHVAETVGRVGGFVAKYMGDGILVYFGYPQAHEDDAERAVMAGLDVVAAVAALKPHAAAALSCRIGIATGLVVVGDLLGTGAAQEQAVVGETPNVAARLQNLAEADTVLVDTRTRQLVGDLFECRFLGAVEIKGFSEPQRAWRAVRQSRVLSRFEALRSGKTPLVGREEEIALLNRRWHQAKVGEGRVVLLSGEPGVGKSRLVAGLIEDLVGEPHARLRYFCSPQHIDSALYPFMGQLEHAAGFEPDEARSSKLDKLDAVLSPVSTPVEDRSLIAELLGLSQDDREYPALDLTPQIRKQRTLEALARQLELLTRRQPVLMIFEDAHWIDPTSLELLDYTVERIRALPVLLLITFRPEFSAPWVGQPHVTALGLSRLDARASAALAGHVTGNRVLPSVLIAEIVDRADGIPLFLEELTKTVVEADASEAGDVVTAVPSSAVAIPATLYASLAARLDRLGPAKEIAQIGAVIGREFPYELLRELTALPETRLAPALDQLVASELVFRRGTPPAVTYAFKHALVQEVAHGTLLRGKRQILHARIADLLAGGLETAERQPEVLAQHYAEAGLSDKAVDYWTRAGKRSAARSAMAEAEAQLEKALAQLAKQPESDARRHKELELQSSLGSVRVAIRGFSAPETGLSYARAREVWGQLGYPSEFLRVAWGQWLFVANRGELDLAHRYADELLRHSDDRGDNPGRILGHLCLGATEMSRGEFGSSRLNLESFLRLYRMDQHQLFIDQTGIDPLVMALAFLGLILACMGYVDQALARGSEAVEKARGVLHRPSLALSLAVKTRVAALLGEDRLVADSAQELLALTIEQGFPFWRAQGVIYRGWAKIRQGELEDGLSLLREGAAAYRATGAEVWTPFHYALEAEAEALRGYADVASGILDEALRKARARGDNWFEAELVRRRGLLFRDRDPATAETLFLEAIDIARRQQAKLWELRGASSLARLWAEAGRSVEAGALLAPVHAWYTEGFDIPDLKEARELLKALGA
jgi:class 3 adenylate cyclase/predicted ATPase